MGFLSPFPAASTRRPTASSLLSPSPLATARGLRSPPARVPVPLKQHDDDDASSVALSTSTCSSSLQLQEQPLRQRNASPLAARPAWDSTTKDPALFRLSAEAQARRKASFVSPHNVLVQEKELKENKPNPQRRLFASSMAATTSTATATSRPRSSFSRSSSFQPEASGGGVRKAFSSSFSKALATAKQQVKTASEGGEPGHPRRKMPLSASSPSPLHLHAEASLEADIAAFERRLREAAKQPQGAAGTSDAVQQKKKGAASVAAAAKTKPQAPSTKSSPSSLSRSRTTTASSSLSPKDVATFLRALQACDVPTPLLTAQEQQALVSSLASSSASPVLLRVAGRLVQRVAALQTGRTELETRVADLEAGFKMLLDEKKKGQELGRGSSSSSSFGVRKVEMKDRPAPIPFPPPEDEEEEDEEEEDEEEEERPHKKTLRRPTASFAGASGTRQQGGVEAEERELMMEMMKGLFPFSSSVASSGRHVEEEVEESEESEEEEDEDRRAAPGFAELGKWKIPGSWRQKEKGGRSKRGD